MLRGVVSTTIVKDPVLSKTQRQQAYVKDSLTRAFNELKLAKLEGKELQSADDFLKELEYGSRNQSKRSRLFLQNVKIIFA